jgi:hypothetical protein
VQRRLASLGATYEATTTPRTHKAMRLVSQQSYDVRGGGGPPGSPARTTSVRSKPMLQQLMTFYGAARNRTRDGKS